MAKEIPLSRGLVALVDDADFESIGKIKWSALASGAKIYAAHQWRHPGGEKSAVLMHRLITEACGRLQVDHINGDGLDNRRANLRLCTKAQNAKNRKQRPPASGFKGVYRRDDGRGSGKRFRALISVDGQRVNLGAFPSALDAARAYDAAARRLHGEFASLNGV